MDGLPIGLDLTRAVARLIMMDWDQQFLRLAAANNVTYHLYSRYMDDTANGVSETRYKVERGGEEDDCAPSPDGGGRGGPQ